MPSKLRQSTATTVQIGPFLDSTDGVTEETGLTPVVEISKAGGAFAARNSAGAVAHDTEGWYRIPIDQTDTNTTGSLVMKAQDSANHLPVWREFSVVPDQDEVSPSETWHGILKASTGDHIVVGPFISRTTKLPLTSLTVGSITCGIIKDAAPPANTSITLTAAAGNNDMVHIANGYWYVEVTATDTNTVGPFTMTFRDDDVFYPVTVRGLVLEGTVYDNLTTSTDGFRANVRSWLGTTVNENTAGYPAVDVDRIDDDDVAATRLQAAMILVGATSVIKADAHSISGDRSAADNLEAACDGTGYNVGNGDIEVNVTKISGDSVAADRLEATMDVCPIFTVDDTAAAPTTTVWESDATEATADHYNDRLVVFITGSNAGQYKQVTDYRLSGGRGEFTTDAFTDAPSNGDTFILQ